MSIDGIQAGLKGFLPIVRKRGVQLGRTRLCHLGAGAGVELLELWRRFLTAILSSVAGGTETSSAGWCTENRAKSLCAFLLSVPHDVHTVL